MHLQGSLRAYVGQMKYMSESLQIDGLCSIAFRNEEKENNCFV